MSKNYCCQIFSVSGRILEIFYEDYLEAVRECTAAGTKAFVFRYPDMETPIASARIVK
jgi:hypothetical protein